MMHVDSPNQPSACLLGQDYCFCFRVIRRRRRCPAGGDMPYVKCKMYLLLRRTYGSRLGDDSFVGARFQGSGCLSTLPRKKFDYVLFNDR